MKKAGSHPESEVRRRNPRLLGEKNRAQGRTIVTTKSKKFSKIG